MKKIILLSDGTGNSAAKKNKTNVWRLYEALDLHQDDQIAMYDDGVGSKDSILSKVLGGAFGVGLKRNVLGLYKYLCRNYHTADQNEKVANDPDSQADKIYLFGFSRGAFTVRVLAGFVAEVGLCTDFKNEQELDKVSRENYRFYRQKYNCGYLAQILWALFFKKAIVTGNIKPDIEAIGAWDTVDAYGFPIDELAKLWDFFIYPLRFPSHQLPNKIRHAYHALSIDDERHSFHPVMWNECAGEKRIEQVWFPGAHADVGGGNPRKSLSLVPLDWMISKVEKRGNNDGLTFITDIRDDYKGQSDWNGPQQNSRSGLAVYYRYKPRNLSHVYLKKYKNYIFDSETPKLHRSVLERIMGRSVPYAPTGIPEKYLVVVTEGAARQYETTDVAAKRCAALNFALDMIYWRRWLYFSLLIITLMLISSRFLLDWDENGVCKGSACFVDPVIQFFISSLPNFTVGWFEALRQNPNWLWGFIILFYLLFKLRNIARDATQKYATCAWAGLKQRGTVAVWKESFTSKLRELSQTTFKKIISWTGATILFFIILYLIWAVINGTMFYLRYTSGSLCTNSESVSIIVVPKNKTLDISNACYATGIQMEQGKTYIFNVQDAVLYDGPNSSGPDGISPVTHIPFVPFRRHLFEPWLALYGKIDAAGYEEFLLKKGTTKYTARADGELFLYVNDGVFGLLSEWDLPYYWKRGKNKGSITVTVSKSKLE